jgi:pimeloyl-ACP methyl ester carboxylesterase
MYHEQMLSDKYEVITVDLLGFGKSAGTGGWRSIAAQAEAASGLIRSLGLRAPSVIGFALGGAVAMQMAATDARLLGSLFVIAVPTPGILDAPRAITSMQRDWPRFARRSAEVLLKNEHGPETVGWLERMFAANSVHIAVDAWRELTSFDPMPLAKAISVPTVFIHGSDDMFTPSLTAENCARVARNGRFHEISGCGHLVMFDQRQALQMALEGYLDELHQ